MEIHKLLQFSKQQYNKMVFDTWFYYCELKTHNQKSFQQLLANTAYFNWFMKEYKRLELEFLQDIEPFIGQAGKEDIREIYEDKTAQIVMFFSRPLKKEALNLKIVNHAY